MFAGQAGSNTVCGGSGIDLMVLWTGALAGNAVIQGHFGNDAFNDIANEDSTDILVINGTTGDDTILISQATVANGGQGRLDFNGSVRTLGLLDAAAKTAVEQFQLGDGD